MEAKHHVLAVVHLLTRLDRGDTSLTIFLVRADLLHLLIGDESLLWLLALLVENA